MLPVVAQGVNFSQGVIRVVLPINHNTLECRRERNLLRADVEVTESKARTSQTP